MILAMTTAERVTAIIATYGAVLSTVAIVKQFISERVILKITVNRDMEIHGDPRYNGMTLIVMKVVNKGSRPVTITHTGAWGLYPNQPFIITDNQPPLAHEIKEGEYITSIVDQADTDVETIDYWQAIDSSGRVYKLHQSSWLRHWQSNRLQKRAAKLLAPHS
jgi:hypothetical protein